VPERPTWLILGALGLVVLASVIIQLWGIVGDLPYAPDVDEPVFIGAAMRLLQHRTLDPGWFGHPGSTVIYPAAFLIEVWYQLARHVPFVTYPSHGIGRAFVDDPMPFYLIGRLLSAAYGVGCVVATWLIGRRVVGDVGGILAAAILPATAIVVYYGQLVRSDTAALFFALIAVWLMLRAAERGRFIDWALPAIAIGLALSTRYFFAALIAPYAVAALLWVRAQPRVIGDRWWSTEAARRPALALLLAPVTFALTSPFVFLDLPRSLVSILAEGGGSHPGADGLTPIGNLNWYVAVMLPAMYGWIALTLSMVGVVLIWRRSPGATAIVLAYAVTYLIGASALPFHWDRYAIPLSPVVGICLAGTLVWVGDRCSRLISQLRGDHPPARAARIEAAGPRRLRWIAASVAALAMFVLLLPSLQTVAAAARLRTNPSTRVFATEWVATTASTTKIAEEMYCSYPGVADDRVLRIGSLAAKSIDAYRAAGYDYLCTSSWMSTRFVDVARYPRESAFYRLLPATGRLVASFSPGPDNAGPTIQFFDISNPRP
jgi:4-amino-4-deoxy-L-arabinose transferase-like glycosyltransferase